MKEKVLTHFFLWHPSKLFEPFKGPVSMATMVGSVFARVRVSSSTCCIFFDAHKHRAVPGASEDSSTD